ncbi:hypothetical protein ED733_000934 [Metarhizium rileyi]|uniref:Homeobox domain-containing protein n=1 Tax=Metarhizium rileyi (strain RCEF 4871) TaxID=1649241 RepID=A0A5C6G4H1_METRR|nr:hypothetical protein ED733_000934 [Metarhizium rileyi]
MGPFSQQQWPSWAYSNVADPFPTYAQFSNYPAYLHDSLDAYQPHHSRLVQHQQISRATESKPRLSKEEVEILEAEFQKNHKPSSTTKKALAESMRVDNARINNWFQNRRAREKKENNIREYEAKQRLEKERSEASDCPPPEDSRQRDLVASSAPFPQPRLNTKTESEAAQSPSDNSPADSSGEMNEPSQSDESDLLSPLPLPIKQNVGIARSANLLMVKTEQEDDDHCALSDQMDDYFAMQEGAMLAVNSRVAGQSLFTTLGGPHDADRHKRETDSSPLTDASEPKSPESVDIASRRNRRPAPLSITSGRSQSYTARASDLSRWGDQTTCMRRISSSTGSGRVKKSAATPRSPFFDRSADIFLQQQRRHSPNAVGRQGSTAPPTPDTPVTFQQQGSMDALMPLYSLEGKYTPPDLVLSDPTLRTPPTTPGFADSLFHLGAGYEIGISEESIIAPGIDRANRAAEMAGNSAAFANYMLNSNSQGSAQQLAPMFPTQMGQSYLGFMSAGSNPEYNWSDLARLTSSTSSSSQQRYMALNHIQN